MNDRRRGQVPFLLVALGLVPATTAAAETEVMPVSPTVPTTIDDSRVIDARTAVRLALEHSPSREVVRLQTEQARLGVTAEKGRYQFVFLGDTSYTQAATPRLQAENAISSNTTRSLQLGTGVRRTFALGTTAELKLTGEWYDNEFGGGFVNPLLNQASGYGARMRLTLKQPLLQGAGTKVGLVELHAAEANEAQATKSERRATSQLVRDVLIAYGELWYATEARRIEEQSLEVARQQEKDALERVRTGSLAPADGYTFSTRVAELEESRVTVAATERTRALELLRLTGASERDGGSADWRANLPPDSLTTPSAGELERALGSGSIELAELEAAVSEARVRAEVAGDSLRPRLDVDGYVESVGLGEDPGSALMRSGQMGWVSGQVGLTLEMPVGAARRNAERASALAAVHAAEANLREARDRVRTEAATSVTTAEAAEARLDLARRTREIAEKTFDAERNRFALGSGLALQVQVSDDDLRRARLREARARIDLFTEQAKLQHLTGRLLGRFGG